MGSVVDDSAVLEWNRMEVPNASTRCAFDGITEGILGEGGVWKTDAACINLPGHGFFLCLFYHPLPEQAINVSKMLPIIVLNNA